uniref:Chitin-binding type-2 domain-containing protein n=1 Tax=Timema poppense TaxID=170557 RepID=A0A7R9H874_TIMPO|nr:unnamed protein product [Timema poppensis]
MQSARVILMAVAALASLIDYSAHVQAVPLSCPRQDSVDYTVLLPHPLDCGLYLICQFGSPTVGKCPLGLHFNPGLQVCDWPQNVGCISSVTSTTSGVSIVQELEDSNEKTESNESIETTTVA